jgi:hypothetical protein
MFSTRNSTFTYVARPLCLFCFEAICDHYLTTVLSWLVDFRSHCFFPHQSDQFVYLLQNFALLFQINYTQINQSQSSNMFMHIIN